MPTHTQIYVHPCLYFVIKNSLYNLISYFQIHILHSGTRDMWLTHSNRQQFHSTKQPNPRTCLLWQLKAHYHLRNSLPLTLILIQINPHHAFLPYLLWIHINFIIPCTLISSSRLLHSGFINKILNALLIPPMHAWMHHPENYKL